MTRDRIRDRTSARSGLATTRHVALRRSGSHRLARVPASAEPLPQPALRGPLILLSALGGLTLATILLVVPSGPALGIVTLLAILAPVVVGVIVLAVRDASAGEPTQSGSAAS